MGLRISTCSHCVRHKLLLLPNCGCNDNANENRTMLAFVMSSVACHRSCKGTPSSPLKPSKKPRPIFLLPFTLNIISLNINIETIIHPDIIHTPSYIYIKGIYIIRYIIINNQSRHYTPHITSRNSFSWFMLIYIYALIQSSCRFALLLPVGQWVYDRSRVLPLSAFKSNHSHHFWRGVGGEAFLLDLKQTSPQGYSCHLRDSCS